MIIVVDTNILARFIIGDDKAQEEKSRDILRTAKTIIIPTVVFCELCWVMSSAYKQPSNAIASAVRKILNIGKVQIKTEEIEAGLKMVDSGGDFADGVIAYVGRAMSNEPSTFLSFDKQAIKILSAKGLSVMNANNF
jgi:predicted nucleic-acid-binding protein